MSIIKQLLPAPLRDYTKFMLTPPAQQYIRRSPLALGKRTLCMRLVDGYVPRYPRRFVTSTVFGASIAGTTSDMIQRYIYYFGQWEPHLTRWIQDRLAPRDTFIDVGANIGYFSLLASHLVGREGAVVAIEASPRIFAHLQDHITRNHARNIRAINQAVADSFGTLKLFSGGESNSGETTTIEGRGFAFECEVHAAPLSDLLQPEEVERARLIKIDVEGAEWSVVRGMASLLPRLRPDVEIVLEVSPERWPPGEGMAADLVLLFAEHGYHPYRLENDYSALTYLKPDRCRRPLRLRTPVTSQTDVIFSRQITEEL